MKKLNLRILPEEHATVSGREFAIENREDGRIFLSNKAYVDKLFDQMGYRGLGVVKILEDFAGKTITEVGSLRDAKVWIDEMTDSFVVATESAVNHLNDFRAELEKRGFKIIEERNPDSYHYWDQLEIESPLGVRFVVYTCLSGEYLQVFSLHYTDDVLDGMINEGTYKLTEESFLDSIFVLLSGDIDASAEYTMKQPISMNEYMTALSILGYVKQKRKRYYLTDEGSQLQGVIGDLETAVEDANIMSWLQRRINPAPNNMTFLDAFHLFSQNLDKLSFWSLKDFYISNAKETSDMFALNA